MKSQSYSDGIIVSVPMLRYFIIDHIRAIPESNWKPAKPKFNGKEVTATTQTENTIHITESHDSKILFERAIVNQLATGLFWIQKSYEPKILIQNTDSKKIKDGKQKRFHCL